VRGFHSFKGMSMRLLLSLTISIALLALAVFGLAQNYAPQKGESVLRLDIEGRGSIFIKLHTKEAPKTTAHIVGLVRKGFYNGQRFFRVVREPRPYLVAVGDPNSKDAAKLDSPEMGLQGSGTRVPYEDSGFKNEAGAVGLSTLPKDRDSGDSQFYMLLAPSRFLDGNYTVFGRIVAGLDVLNKIQKGDVVVRASIVQG
jgi:cyclophilin family peptidyl-prolyl cis-trans isomerase